MVDLLVHRWTDRNGNANARLVDLVDQIPKDRMEHLSCFVPGMLALGANYGSLHNVDRLLSRKSAVHRRLAVFTLTKTDR
jgi:hypothetical protein